MLSKMWLLAFVCCALGVVVVPAAPSQAQTPGEGNPEGSNTGVAPEELDEAEAAAIAALIEEHGEGEAERIRRGVAQAARYWRAEDGSAAEFQAFAEAEFLPQGESLDLTFQRFEFALERMDGYLVSLGRDLRRGADLDLGPMLPLDGRLAAYNPSAHVADDLFANKIAFIALLNFPVTSLETKLAEGMTWSRRQWAETRLAERFTRRVPAEVNQVIRATMAEADSYINNYNIYLHHLLTGDGERLFPPGLRLISHWGLRDELKANYNDPSALAKQRMIMEVFDRIVDQTIPASVVNNPRYDWTPQNNVVELSTVEDAPVPPGGEGRKVRADERYYHWLKVFLAQQLADPYFPENPTFIDRRFNSDREVPEAEVRGLLIAVLDSPLRHAAGKLVEQRLGRRLAPFDIWYNGFKPGNTMSETELDALTRERYPTVEAFAADIPRVLGDLGFSAEQSQLIAERVVVEPSRGAGHAFGGARRDDNAHLRTRVGEGGMDYKGYNIAVHELGHNVEQIFSLTTIDHTLLQGVPNTAFTEALAFVFQNRDLELLGVAAEGSEDHHLAALDAFWGTREIAGVALVDIEVWNWLYENPTARPAGLRDAVVRIAKDVWNRYFADVFGVKDQTLLAVYSHMIDAAMYTPDYPLGHLIAHQVEEHFRTLPDEDNAFGTEFQRICRLGQLTPDAWMRQAVGAPLSAEPLLTATEAALGVLKATGEN